MKRLARLLLCALILFVYALVLTNIVADRCSKNLDANDITWEEDQQ